MKKRAEIIAAGLVQGVGFRYYVAQHAKSLKLTGYVKNLFSGEVLTVVEGEIAVIEDLFQKINIGPSRASVNQCKIVWGDFKNEFKTFEVKF